MQLSLTVNRVTWIRSVVAADLGDLEHQTIEVPPDLAAVAGVEGLGRLHLLTESTEPAGGALVDNTGARRGAWHEVRRAEIRDLAKEIRHG